MEKKEFVPELKLKKYVALAILDFDVRNIDYKGILIEIKPLFADTGNIKISLRTSEIVHVLCVSYTKF